MTATLVDGWQGYLVDLALTNGLGTIYGTLTRVDSAARIAYLETATHGSVHVNLDHVTRAYRPGA